jgi:hypothetical protein
MHAFDLKGEVFSETFLWFINFLAKFFMKCLLSHQFYGD